MGKESFIFYSSFDEALSELSDKSRLKIYDAICDYALRGNESELRGVEKAVFSLIKPQIKANNQRYENGKKGGAPMNNKNAVKKQPKNNQETTDGCFDSDSEEQPKNNQKQANENVNVNVNVNTPPISPPKGGSGSEKERFLTLYPAFKGAQRVKDENVDYAVLIREFEKSAMLRGMYSLSKVCSIYEAIKRGDFRDKKDPAVEAADYRADRERWYSQRRAQAESKRDDVMACLKRDKNFVALNGEIAKKEIEIARAEIEEDDFKLNQLLADREYAVEQRRELLERNGLTEDDLKVKYFCENCSDTGYLPDGRACSCYEEANG